MAENTAIEHCKRTAMGWKGDARRVLTPVLLSTARHGKIESHGNGHLRISVERGPFAIRFITYDAKTLDFRVRWEGELVMRGLVEPHGFRPLTGEIEIITWKRGPKVSAWQTELFEVFPASPFSWDVPLSAKYALLQVITSP